jgi:hypothetical protein
LTKLLKIITNCSFSWHLCHESKCLPPQAFDPVLDHWNNPTGECAKFSMGSSQEDGKCVNFPSREAMMAGRALGDEMRARCEK